MMLGAAGPPLWPIVIPAVAVVATGVIAAVASAMSTARANNAAHEMVRLQNAHALAMTREQHESELGAQRHQRVEERRAEAYCALLEKVRREQLSMLRIYPVVAMTGPPMELPPQLSDDAELALLARVVAYGSPAVDALRTEWAGKTARFAGLSAAIHAGEETGPTMLTERIGLEELRRSAFEVLQRLEAQVRLELQGPALSVSPAEDGAPSAARRTGGAGSAGAS